MILRFSADTPKAGSAQAQDHVKIPTYRLSCYKLPTTTATPESLFHPAISTYRSGYRYICRNRQDEMLIYTDGACLRNGQVNPAAGCAFVYSPSGVMGIGELDNRCVSFRLEAQGPTGEPHPQTSNRAELRAVIAALEFLPWDCEGFSHVVIATDSEYVVKGATQWAYSSWLRNGWRTVQNRPVANRDLWEKMFAVCSELETRMKGGLQVSFWRIPREWNLEADRGAKFGARKEFREEYNQIIGTML